MSTQHARRFSRRRFLRGITLAGPAGLLGGTLGRLPPSRRPRRRGSDYRRPPVFVSPRRPWPRIWPLRGSPRCNTSRVQSPVSRDTWLPVHLTLSMTFAPLSIIQVDVEAPIVFLGGVHVGCFELFGTERVQAIRDLKGKTVAIPEQAGVHHLFLASMAQYVGLDPRTDIHWVLHSPTESMQLLAEEKIDALVGFPPVPQELRAKQIGRMVVNSALDRPWSQYFCCLITGNRDFVRKHPMATKRALRAILKATDVCAFEPSRAAQLLVDKGYTHGTTTPSRQCRTPL